ncbi:MAG: hypothetical protein PGN13_05005 [Patulibacter minatonensis]
MVGVEQLGRRVVLACGAAAAVALVLLGFAGGATMPDGLDGVGSALRPLLFAIGALFVLATAWASRPAARAWPAALLGAALVLASSAASPAFDGRPVALLVSGASGLVVALTVLALVHER